MKRILILIGIFVMGMAATASAIDAPHSATNNIACVDCHSAAGFPDNLVSPGVPPDSSFCLSCHSNTTGGGYSKTSAPFEKTHSSANTSTHYGTWGFLCRDCHEPHSQEQPVVFGSQAYLATGKITSIANDTVNNRTVYGYSNLTIILPEWADLTKWGNKSTNNRGLILFANNIDAHEIISVDSVNQKITVQGTTPALATNVVAVNNPFSVTYGQFLGHADGNGYDSGINTPFGRTTPLFFTNVGSNASPHSFAFDESGTGTDPTPNGVCQICHTKTQHWRYDGTQANHNNGLRCTECHAHSEGFKASCNTCHGDPPPPLAGQSGSTPTGSTTAGAHVFHAVTQKFDCGICHFNSVGTGATHQDGKITLGFKDLLGTGTITGGSYDGQTTANYESSDPGTTVSNTGTKTCTNIYCHSNVQGNGGTSSRTYASPVWDGAVQCGDCHKADGVQGNKTLMDSGSHTKHVSAPYSKPCSECHNGFGEGSPQHVDYNIDLAFVADPFNRTGSYSQSPNNPPGNGYGSCSNVYCHSVVQGPGGVALVPGAPQYSTPTWGSSVVCGDCHGVPPPTGSHQRHSSNNLIAYDFDCGFCHYQAGYFRGTLTPLHVNKIIEIAFDPSRGAAATYSLGASVVPGSGYGTCSTTYCHSDGTGGTLNHDASNNGDPRPIAANTSPLWGSSTTCGSCHGGGNTTGQPSYPNGSPKANSHPVHPSDCSLCHYTTTTTGTTITNVSKHNNQLYDLQPNTSASVSFSYSYAPTGGSCSAISCHSGNQATWGGTVACGGCHAIPPATGAHATHIQDASLITKVYGNTEVVSNQNNYAFGCGNCHPTDPAKHGNGVVDISLNPADGGTLKSKNDPAANRTGTGLTTVCNMIYCHSNGASGRASNLATAASPQWGGTYSGDKCAGCHSNSPTGTPAHGAHVVGIHYDNIYTNISGLETAGNTGTSSHGLSSTATTINCNICHNNTVTASGNDQNTVCATCHDGTKAKLEGSAAIANKTFHVNGRPDIAFASITMQSKAQIRDDITKVTELNNTWTRQSGYKAIGSHDQANSFAPSYDAQTRTCSSVACHNGYQVNWDAQNVTCNSCHTDLPH